MKTRNLALCGLFTALLVICAWLSLPFGSAPITLQTFGIFLCFGVLGGKRSIVVVTTYLLIGAVGFPAFSAFRGGIGALLDTSGGYLLGFLVAAFLYWLITSLCGNRPVVKLTAMAVSLLASYVSGSLWFYLLYLKSGNAVTLTFIFLNCVLPYLIPDTIKLILAWQLSSRLSPLLNK